MYRKRNKSGREDRRQFLLGCCLISSPLLSLSSQVAYKLTSLTGAVFAHSVLYPCVPLVIADEMS